MHTHPARPSIAGTPQRLFPLYLTPLEKLFYYDDRDSHPMTFVIRLELSGTADRRALQAAIEAALVRHPLLHANVRRAKRNRLCWVAGEGVGPAVDWADGTNSIVLERGERIDLTHETGLRVWGRQVLDKVEITMQFHHACTDGIGAYRFIGDVLAFYGLSTCGDEAAPKLSEVDVGRLRRRVDLQVELWPTKRYFAMMVRGLTQAWRVVSRRPARLFFKAAGAPPTASFPRFISAALDRDEHESLRENARGYGATLNELLLAILFRTLRDWRRDHQAARNAGRLRIMMPVDLRRSEDFNTPAACLTSYSFLTRDETDCDDAADFVPSIHRETQRIISQRAGLQFADAVAIGFKPPGVMRLVLNLPVSLATAVLSNVGDPARRFTSILPRRGGRVVAGNLVLDEVTGVPPIRPNTSAVFSIFTYRRRLVVSMACEAGRVSAEEAESVLATFVGNLRRCAAEGLAVAR